MAIAVFLAIAGLAFLGLAVCLIRKAVLFGDCSLPDDDGENIP